MSNSYSNFRHFHADSCAEGQKPSLNYNHPYRQQLLVLPLFGICLQSIQIKNPSYSWPLMVHLYIGSCALRPWNLSNTLNIPATPCRFPLGLLKFSSRHLVSLTEDLGCPCHLNLLVLNELLQIPSNQCFFFQTLT